MSKLLINVATINRPKTSEICIKQLLANIPRDKVILVVQDQNSNEQTKEMLYRYRLDFDIFKEWEWNIGCAFEINYAMSLSEGDFLDVNSDAHLYSPDWYDMCMYVKNEFDIGIVAARRPTFWIERLDKLEMFKTSVYPELRKNIWCEFITNSIIIGPFWMMTRKVIDRIGYINERTLIDDIDYAQRVDRTGLKSCYIPDVIIKQPQDEKQDHPQYSSHKAMLNRTQELEVQEIIRYAKNDIYRGTRFLPNTIKDYEYMEQSNYNWEWFKNWKE